MSSQSNYNEIKRSKIPHAKRKNKLRGSGDDDGKYYRCWNCGFTNNVDRNVVGDGEGLTYTINTLPNEQNVNLGYEISTSGEAVLIDSAVQEKHAISAHSQAGCALCGSMNYK